MMRFAVAGVEGDVVIGCILFILGTLVLAAWPPQVRALPMPARLAIGTGLTFFGLYIGFGG